jgi:hypothetical protein
MTDTDKFYETRREERRRDRAAAAMFVRACQTGDVEMMLEAVDQLNDLTVTGWTVAMRKLVREVSKVSPEIQAAFLPVWIESKMLPLRVYDHRALCAAVRVLLPQYRGPSVRVFRGAAANERRCRLYGLSWTTDIEVAEKFADERRVWHDGSVLLETLAPRKAILCNVTEAGGHYAESEYLVDRRYLNRIRLVRRYPQAEETRALTAAMRADPI